MRTKEFLSKVDHDRVVSAIRDAEAQTAAELRVYIQRGKFDGDPLEAAARRFQKLGMNATDHRASVLVWVAPRAHKFAVFGDQAAHDKLGESVWSAVVGRMREHFRNERFSDALADGISDIGQALASHFPKRA